MEAPPAYFNNFTNCQMESEFESVASIMTSSMDNQQQGQSATFATYQQSIYPLIMQPTDDKPDCGALPSMLASFEHNSNANGISVEESPSVKLEGNCGGNISRAGIGPSQEEDFDNDDEESDDEDGRGADTRQWKSTSSVLEPGTVGLVSNGGQLNQQQISPLNQQQHQPLSVIVHRQRLQQSTAAIAAKQQMETADDCCWASTGDGGQQHSSMLIRDDFLFARSSQCASPPSASVPGPDFLYDHPLASDGTNSILEDSFLLSSSQHIQNSVLDPPCSSSAPFLELQRHRDGSVGVSPCSSSTHISSSSPDDSLFAPSSGYQQPVHNGEHHQQFVQQSHIAGGILRHFSLIDTHGTRASKVSSRQQMQSEQQQQLIAGQQQQPFLVLQQQHRQPLVYRSQGGRGKGEEVVTGINVHDDEEEEEPMEDVKPVFKMVHPHPHAATHPMGLLATNAFDEGAAFEEEEYDDEEFALSPPPPPLTPPSKTRSKMHDLALKHRLISSQNGRGHGLIQLSPEERKTLLQEGFPIPTKLPLMREEEEALKIVRRKIKNKLSAQESRRKRKEYMDMLEKRVNVYFADNTAMRQRIRQLEATNRCLQAQLQRVHGAAGENGNL